MIMHKGFTLIELLVATAIVGIISAIALPIYEGFFSKAQHAGAVQEISSGKSSMEISFYHEEAVTDPSQINLPASTKNCSSISANNDLGAGTALIECTLQGTAEIHGKTVSLQRSSAGVWSCSSTAPAQYTAHCQ